MNILKNQVLVENESNDVIIVKEDKLPPKVLCRVIYPIANFGQPNANRRVYTKPVFERVINDSAIQDQLKNRTLYGHSEHPEGTQSKTPLISHIVTKIWVDENRAYNEIDVLDTPEGRIIDTLLQAGCKCGVSTRAEGDLEENINEKGERYYRVIPESYKYKTTDFTADPSTFGAVPIDIKRNIVSTLKKELESKDIKDDEKKFAKELLESMKCKNDKCQSCGCCAKSEMKEDKEINITKNKNNSDEFIFNCPHCGKSLMCNLKGKKIDDIWVECPSCKKSYGFKEMDNKDKIKNKMKEFNKLADDVGIPKKGVEESKTNEEQVTLVVDPPNKTVNVIGDVQNLKVDDTSKEPNAVTVTVNKANNQTIMPEVAPNTEPAIGAEPATDEPATDEFEEVNEPEEKEHKGETPIDAVEHEEKETPEEEEDEHKNESKVNEEKTYKDWNEYFELYKNDEGMHQEYLKDKDHNGFEGEFKDWLKERYETVFESLSPIQKVSKQINDLKVKEAVSRAEREAAMELVESLKHKDLQAKVAISKANELKEDNQSNESIIKSLRTKLEEKVKDNNDLTIKLQSTQKELMETKSQFTKLNNENRDLTTKLNTTQKQIDESKKQESNLNTSIKTIIKEYIDKQLNGIKVHDNLRALLEKCQTLSNVDSILDEHREVVRRALHSRTIDEIQIQNTKLESPEEERIGRLVKGVLTSSV